MTIILTLSSDGRGLEGTLPGGNTIVIPADERAGALLEHILLAQGAPSGRSKIGTSGSPIQYVVDEWLRANRVTTYDSKGREHKRDAPSLAELGLA